MCNSTLSATVVITTKDRHQDLRKALLSCTSQNPVPEIIVVDDASSDGTSQMVQAEFPRVRLVQHRQATGYIVGRNEAAALATGDIIFSIDDDAAFTTPDIVSAVASEFSDERVGAVAIPYADVNRDGVERQRAPSSQSFFATDRFIGTAHAIRRDIFLQLKGYREFFFHQGEESDFCIRMLQAGYFVRLGNSDRINHFESPKRDTRRMDLYGRRNDILFGVLNVPFVCLLPHLLGVTLKGMWFGVKIGRPIRMFRGFFLGYLSAIRYFAHRRPVTIKTYRRFRKLRKEVVIQLDRLR